MQADLARVSAERRAAHFRPRRRRSQGTRRRWRTAQEALAKAQAGGDKLALAQARSPCTDAQVALLTAHDERGQARRRRRRHQPRHRPGRRRQETPRRQRRPGRPRRHPARRPLRRHHPQSQAATPATQSLPTTPSSPSPTSRPCRSSPPSTKPPSAASRAGQDGRHHLRRLPRPTLQRQGARGPPAGRPPGRRHGLRRAHLPDRRRQAAPARRHDRQRPDPGRPGHQRPARAHHGPATSDGPYQVARRRPRRPRAPPRRAVPVEVGLTDGTYTQITAASTPATRSSSRCPPAPPTTTSVSRGRWTGRRGPVRLSAAAVAKEGANRYAKAIHGTARGPERADSTQAALLPDHAGRRHRRRRGHRAGRRRPGRAGPGGQPVPIAGLQSADRLAGPELRLLTPGACRRSTRQPDQCRRGCHRGAGDHGQAHRARVQQRQRHRHLRRQDHQHRRHRRDRGICPRAQLEPGHGPVHHRRRQRQPGDGGRAGPNSRQRTCSAAPRPTPSARPCASTARTTR